MRIEKQYIGVMLKYIIFFLLLQLFVRASYAIDQAVIHPGGGNLLEFWAEKENKDHWVGENQLIILKANYGQIKTVMMEDVQGNIMGAEIDPRSKRDNVPLQEPVNISVQKRNERGSWDAAPASAYSLVRMGTGMWGCAFREQGQYRFVIILEPNVPVAFPRQTPRYSNWYLVKDKKYERSEGITAIRLNMPKPFSGSGMTIDNRHEYSSCQKSYGIYSEVKKSRIQAESDMQMISFDVPWRLFREAVWTLNASGQVIATQQGGDGFDFRAKDYGDGEYEVRAALPDSLQGQGIQNFKINPTAISINVINCGEGPYWSTPEGQAKKKAIANKGKEADTVVKEEDLAELKLNGFNNQGQQVQIPFIHKQIVPDVPPPGKVPVNLDECSNVMRQVVKRKANLKISCDPPKDIMTALLGVPAKHRAKAKEFQKEWNDAIAKIAGNYVPFMELQKKWDAFLKKVVKENAAIPPEALAQEKRSSSRGGAPIIGDGLPPAMFEFNPAKIKTLKELDTEQRTIASDWAKARGNFGNELKNINDGIKAANKKFDGIYQDLMNIRQELWGNKRNLSDMFMSGEFEHCLGQFTMGKYKSVPVNEAIALGLIKEARPGIESIAMREGDVSPLGLPGMNIDVAVSEKRVMPEIKNGPPQLKQVRLKQDGVWQQRHDRQVVESMVEEAKLKAYAKHGTFWIWLADTVYNKLTFGAIDAGVYDGIADPDMPFYEKMGKFMLASGKSAEHMGKTIGKMGEQAMSGIYSDIFEKPVWETASTTNFLYSIPEGIGDDIKNTLRALGKSVGLMENEFNAKPFEGLGDSLRENSLAVQNGLDQLRWIKEQSEEIDGTTNNLIAVLGVAAEKMMALSKAKGMADKAARLQAFKEGLEKGKDGLNTMRKEVDDLIEVRKLAEDIKKSGKPVPDDWQKKLDEFNKADELAQKEIEDALKKQAEKKALELEAAKAKLNQPPQGPVEPKNLGAEDVNKFNEVLSKEGRMGDVFKEPGNQKEVFKVMKADLLEPKTLEDALEKMNHNLQREKKGADLLGELGLEHAEITGVGNVKGKIKLTDGTFVESDKIPCMTKDYIGEGKKIEGQFLDKLMKSNDPTVMSAGGKLSDEVQSAIVEYLNTANKKGVLLGDFKPDNIYLKKEGGRWKVGVADTDGIAKIADPAKARELQIAQLTSELGPIKHPGFVRGEIARYTEAASVGGFENLIDEKFINMLKNGDVLDNVAQNKAIREIQNNPGAVLQGDALNKVQAAQKVVDEAIKKVEASQSSAMNIARELLEESKKKGGFISKQGLPDPGDLDIPANLLGGPADGGFIDFGFDISSIGPADIAVSRMAA